MRQRVMIAMAIANSPALIIADEPTTALDVTIQAQILELMRDLQQKMGTSILLITHDLGVVAETASRVIVMYGGEVVEEAASGSEAVRRIEGADPDVVVIDYRMPGMDGLDTARTIKGKRPGQLMVLYTAFIDADLQKAADEAGVAVCLGKVEGLASLEREISRLCTSLF